MPQNQASKSEFKARALEFFRQIGSVVRYENPNDPVADGEWEAAQ